MSSQNGTTRIVYLMQKTKLKSRLPTDIIRYLSTQLLQNAKPQAFMEEYFFLFPEKEH